MLFASSGVKLTFYIALRGFSQASFRRVTECKDNLHFFSLSDKPALQQLLEAPRAMFAIPQKADGEYRESFMHNN